VSFHANPRPLTAIILRHLGLWNQVLLAFTKNGTQSTLRVPRTGGDEAFWKGIHHAASLHFRAAQSSTRR
jgi:hypothetical protein